MALDVRLLGGDMARGLARVNEWRRYCSAREYMGPTKLFLVNARRAMNELSAERVGVSCGRLWVSRGLARLQGSSVSRGRLHL